MNIDEENERRRQIREIIRQHFLKHPEQFPHIKKEADGYSLEEKFQKGYLTLNDMDWLITNNLRRAAEKGLRLSWRLTKTSVFGQVFDDEHLVWDHEYTEGYLHRRTVEMQFDFDLVLNHWENFDEDFKDGV